MATKQAVKSEPQYDADAVARGKEMFPYPWGMLAAAAEIVMHENPEGSDLYEKAYRLEELTELTHPYLPSERQKEEMTKLAEELIWQVLEWPGRGNIIPAWPAGVGADPDYDTMGLH